jgi:hypothetical protein
MGRRAREPAPKAGAGAARPSGGDAMPLSKPAPRKQIHARDIECRGYQRDDGLWDIEGRMRDTKSYTFESFERGHVAAGEPVHLMWVRLTIDDDFVVRDAEAATDAGPFAICGDAASKFPALKGLKIAAGWRRAVLERMGGVEGCTHLTDLLTGPLAVTAFQTLFAVRERRQAADPEAKPATLDTCHALASTSPVVKRRWPRFYTGT